MTYPWTKGMLKQENTGWSLLDMADCGLLGVSTKIWLFRRIKTFHDWPLLSAPVHSDNMASANTGTDSIVVIDGTVRSFVASTGVPTVAITRFSSFLAMRDVPDLHNRSCYSHGRCLGGDQVYDPRPLPKILPIHVWRNEENIADIHDAKGMIAGVWKRVE